MVAKDICIHTKLRVYHLQTFKRENNYKKYIRNYKLQDFLKLKGPSQLKTVN